ncbi:hypothetical protein L1D32_02165 [Shewanella insulae]|uniref:hypothetical protein n=1 Tax=Shewanella insulae TaxID=2681496 RepID=UPI001EFC46E4|nr:hypothetical protein [Shewanella insulae]MCG9736966.1 hypothetical protein [Shewanella insulae]
MIKLRMLEALCSLLFGAALFYSAAPGDTGVSFFPMLLDLEPLYICFAIWLILSGLVAWYFGPVKWPNMLVFGTIGMLAVVLLYPVEKRVYQPPSKIVAAAKQYLDDNNVLYSDFEAIERTRSLFDPFRPHYWTISVYANNKFPSEVETDDSWDLEKHGQFAVYVRESFWGTLDIKSGTWSSDPSYFWHKK